MTRCKFFNELNKIFKKDDIVFCIGDLLALENKLNENFCVYKSRDTSIDYLSVALGVAMSCDRRVFFICEDSYFMSVFNSVLQASISKCSNLYIFLVRSNLYSLNMTQLTLTSSLRSLKGTLFNLGFLVHDYTPYFNSNKSVRQLESIIMSSIGPLVGIIEIDSNRLYKKEENLEYSECILKFMLEVFPS